MITELNTIFSGAVGADGTRTAQAITATAVSTNVIDTRTQPLPTLQDTGVGGSMLYLVVCCLQAFNNLTSLTITLETDTASNMATSPTVHLTFTVPLAALTAGAVIACAPLPSASFKRFMATRYAVTGTNPGQGSVMAYLSADPPGWQAYPSAVKLDV